MGQAKLRGLLAFSAMLALGSAPGWTRLAMPDRTPQQGALERVSGKADKAATDPQAAVPAGEGREDEPEAKEKGKRPHKPSQRPSRPKAGDGSPAREEKSDCDDCVIVRPEGSGDPADRTAGRSGMSGSSVLAGTLWGLFMVARPKRMPRTIIRGVTVP